MATFTVRGKNMEVTPALREYVEKRVGKVTKYFEHVGEITVLLTASKGRHIVEVTVPVDKGVILRGEEATMDMYTSIDLVVDKLERQIHKHKTKLQKRFRGGGFKSEMVAEEAGRPQTHIDEHADEHDKPRLLRIQRLRHGGSLRRLSPHRRQLRPHPAKLTGKKSNVS